jgi:coenzyme PQQ precursor peptide PqqA
MSFGSEHDILGAFLSEKAHLRAPADHDNCPPELDPARDAASPSSQSKQQRGGARFSVPTEETTMAWTTPVIVEVCVGMEITSYSSAEI